MPIYEYECRQCGHRFEYLVLSTSPAAECPSCQHQDLTRMMSLSSPSTESSRGANLSAAHRKAAAVRGEKQRSDHKSNHEHFEG